MHARICTRTYTQELCRDACYGWFCKLLTKHKLQEIMNDKSNGNQNDTEMLPPFLLFGINTEQKKENKMNRSKSEDNEGKYTFSKMQFDDV